MRKVSAALAFMSLTLSAGAHAEGWLCVSESSTGFAYDETNESWQRSGFKSNDRYVIRPNRKDGLTWEVAQLGKNADLPISECGVQPNEAGVLICNGSGNEFRINIRNLRFIHVYWLGYWTYDPNNWVFKNEAGDTPSMSIGKCSAI
jgi:hypothetical protein